MKKHTLIAFAAAILASFVLPSCLGMKQSTAIAMAAASDPVMTSSDKAAVLKAAIESGAQSPKSGWDMPYLQIGCRVALNEPVRDKEGNPVFWVDPATGRPMAVTGGWTSSGVQGNKDVMGTLKYGMTMYGGIKASDNALKDSNRKEIEATKRAQSADAVKAQKIQSDERVKTFVPEEPAPTKTP